jgi:hypothetical protein
MPVKETTMKPRPQTRPCPACQHVVHVAAYTCPNCGRKMRPSAGGTVGWLLLIGAIIVGALWFTASVVSRAGR